MIKAHISKAARYLLQRISHGKLSNDSNINLLMQHFRADESGHQANIASNDLGYGWIHYGLIRQIKPMHVLCIGSRHGYIPAICAQACKDNNKGSVDFVDAGYGKGDKNHWTGVGYWKTKKGKGIFNKHGLKKYITNHITTTSQFAKTNKIMYDYIYI